MNKKYFIIISLFLIFISISAVTANNDSNQNEHSVETTDNDIKTNIDTSQDISLNNVNNYAQSTQEKSSITKKNNNNTKSYDSLWYLEINPETTYAGDNITINVNITTDDGHTVNMGSFNYYFNNEFIGNSLIRKNQSEISYKVPDNYGGTYNLDLIYLNQYNKTVGREYSNTIKVVSNNTVVLESDLPKHYPSDINNTLTVYVKDLYGNISNRTGYLNFSLIYPITTTKGPSTTISKIGSYYIDNGICKINFNLNDNDIIWSYENYPVDFTFIFDYHDSVTDNDITLSHSFDLMEYNNIEMNAIKSTAYAGDTLNISFTGYDMYHETKLLIYINNKYVDSIKFSDKSFGESESISYSYKVPSNYSGFLNIKAKAMTKNGFNSSQTYENNINIIKPKNTTITGVNVYGYGGKNVTFKGTVIDENKNTVKTGRIVVKLNGKTVKSDIYLNKSNKFTYTYTIPANFSAKKYTITYVYVGNENYGRSELNKTLTVVAKPTKIIAADVSGFAGEKITFSGSVLDINNNPVTSGRIVLKLNGKTIKSDIYLTNSNKFSYKYTIPAYVAKDYVLTYVYVGNKKYQRAELNKTFSIKNQQSKITANSVVNYHEKTVTITVNITGAKTGIDAAKGSVGIKLNGNTIKVNDKALIQNVSNGVAVFKYKIPSTLKAGKYQVMITYSGGRFLLGSKTNTSTLTVKDHITKISIKAPKTQSGQTVRILASVNDSLGKINSGKATFKLNGQVIGTGKICNGAAVLYYTIPDDFLGKYVIEVLAKGTYTDLNSSKATLTVVN